MTETPAPARKAGPEGADTAPIAEAIGVSKRYGATVALSDASLCVLPGELHALVGRNGAGKSTLVGILTGVREPDSGEVRFRGEPAPAISDREGWRQRVACVYQHSTIIPDLTVAENLFINRQPLKRGFISWGALWREAREVLDRWDVSVSERSRAGDLKVEARQLVEIARALSYGARFIILDEPTAQLDGEEIKRLFAQMRRLQTQGVTFLFISHHLQEVYEVCQTVTVLRDARRILTAPAASLPKDALIEAMTGEQVSFGFADAANRKASTEGPVALEVKSLGGEDFEGVSFAVRKGEIIGLCGATSSGRLGVAEAVAGLGPYKTGTIRDQRRRPAGGRRSCGSGARRRLRAEEPAQARPRSHPVDRRQCHDADRQRARAPGLHRARAPGGVREAGDRNSRRRDRRAGSARLGPLRRQPAEGGDGPRAREPPIGSGPDRSDGRR